MFIIKKGDQQGITLAPSFKHAQSLDSFYVQVPFSEKIDGEGCQDVYDESIKFTDTSMHFHAYCSLVSYQTWQQNDTLVKWELDWEFEQEIDKEASRWEIEKVGRLFLHIKKKEAPARWKYIFKDETYKPSNSFVWIEMYNKYIDALEDFEPMDEDDEWSIII